ncbi:hypothetical protein PSY31_23595, partial [Shigella flexneri]|nr:hypothetical protein [Shigella flexneri]
ATTSAPNQRGTSLEDALFTLTNNTNRFQQNTEKIFEEIGNDLANIKTIVTHLASTMGQWETEMQGKFPAQVMPNPKENANAV